MGPQSPDLDGTTASNEVNIKPQQISTVFDLNF